VAKTTHIDLTFAPRLKIERAKRHIDDLNARVEKLIASGALYTAVTEFRQRNQVAIEARIRSPIPPEFSLVVGDAIHNLRSALDLLIFAMIGEKAKKPDNVQFPFGKNLAGFEDACVRRELELAGKYVVDELYKLKPYRDGNKLLAGIHVLDIQDKHRLLIPVAQQQGLSVRQIKSVAPHAAISASPGYEDSVFIKGTSGQVIFSGPPAWGWTKTAIGFPVSIEHKSKAPIPVTVGFGDEEFFNSEPVVPKLLEMADHIAEVIENLAQAYLGAIP
jgi:hypothetical protein